MTALAWVALSYRLPREPSRHRLAVWRRLKRLGAIVLHDAVWLLPADARTREALEWLAEEVEEQGGSAFVWEATSLGAAQDRAIAAQFRLEADERYAAIAESAKALRRARRGHLHQARRRLAGLERALRLEARRDHFRASGRPAAEEALRMAGRVLREEPRGARSDGKRQGVGADALGH